MLSSSYSLSRIGSKGGEVGEGAEGRGPVRRGEEGKQGHILTQKYIVCVCS